MDFTPVSFLLVKIIEVWSLSNSILSKQKVTLMDEWTYLGTSYSPGSRTSL